MEVRFDELDLASEYRSKGKFPIKATAVEFKHLNYEAQQVIKRSKIGVYWHHGLYSRVYCPKRVLEELDAPECLCPCQCGCIGQELEESGYCTDCVRGNHEVIPEGCTPGVAEQLEMCKTMVTQFKKVLEERSNV